MNSQFLTIDSNCKAPLSKAIKKEYCGLLRWLCLVPDHKWVHSLLTGTGGRVSVSDLVAYQIGGGSLLISWDEAGIRGDFPQMPGDGFTSWAYEDIAKHFYKKWQFNDPADQVKCFQRIVTQIIGIVDLEFSTGNLELEGVWDWATLKSGKMWPLSRWVHVNTVAPYKRAADTIRRHIHELT